MRFKLVPLLTTLLLFLTGQSVFAQFTYDKIKDGFVYEQPKPITYYTNSRFNRIEGFFANIGARVKPQQIPGLAFTADAGYGFSNRKGERFRYSAGVQKDFFVPDRFSLGAQVFDQVFTNDKWIISETENSVAALFSHNDYMDYVARQGFLLFADYKLQQIHNLRIEFARYDYDTLSVTANTDFSLFQRGDDYAANPHPFPFARFAPGTESVLRLMGNLDFRDNPIFPLIGWYLETIFERTFDDFSTSGLFLTVKRFQPTFGNQRARGKLMLGSRSGSFAFQHLIGLGGVGNLRGYDNKEFVGNRAIFGTIQYSFGGDLLQRLPLQRIPFWEALSLGVFWEFGYAWFAEPANANAGLLRAGEFSLSDIRSDAGISLIFTEGLLRFDFARRFDRSGSNWTVFFRILDKF